MTDQTRIISVFSMLYRPAVLLLLGLLITIFTLPAGAAIISYQMTGSIGGDGGEIFDTGTFNPTGDMVFVAPDPFPNAVSFTLSFDLDDSISGTPAGSNGSSFLSAISNLDLMIDGMPFFSNSSVDLDEFDNGSNHQWSIFNFGGNFMTGASLLDVEDDLGDIVDSLDIGSMDLFLLDTDATLFSQSPPELAVINGGEFEFAEIELNWFGGTYDYNVIGTIDTITASAVPVPGAFWLFGSALLGLSGIARRKKA